MVEKSDTERLWVACKHAVDGTAAEVWCRPDRLAICVGCAEKGPDAVPESDLLCVCPVCLNEALATVPLVRLRELLEQDVIAGHCHGREN
jgi:hypothetical protein